MKLTFLFYIALSLCGSSLAGPVPEGLEARDASPQKGNKHLRPVLEKRQKFDQGQPISAEGKGAPFSGKSLLLH